MRNLIIALLVMLAVGCSPSRRIQNLYERHPDLKPKESLVTTITIHDTLKEVRDTTIYVKLPSDTIWKKVEVPLNPFPGSENVKINSDTLKASTNLAEARAWIYQSELNLFLADKDTTLEIKLENAIQQVTFWKEKYEEKQTVMTEKVAPLWIKYIAISAGFAWVIIAIFISSRMRL